MKLEEFMSAVKSAGSLPSVHILDEKGEERFILHSGQKPHDGMPNPFYTSEVLSVSAVGTDEFAVTVKTKRDFLLMDDEESESFRPYGWTSNLKR